MIISKINIWRGKVYIYLDSGENFELSKPVFEESRLKTGDEISCAQKENLINTNEIFLIKASSLRILERREHSAKELKDKLLKKGFSENNIRQVLKNLIELNFLNDERFAEIYVRSRIKYKRKSPKAIYFELLKKGVDKELIENELRNLDEEIILDNARALAKKKLISLNNRNSGNKLDKLRSHLTYKAYSSRIINQIIEETRKEVNDA